MQGNTDLVINNRNGYVVGIDDVEQFANSIKELHQSPELRDRFAKQSLIDVKNMVQVEY